MIRYFAYGVNTNKEEFLLRIPPAVYVGKACLPDYQFVMREASNIVPKKNEKVWGVLWDIPVGWIADLDRDEADYERQTVHVVWRKARVKAMAYVMLDDIAGIPSEGYVRDVSKGYSENKLPLRQLKSAL